MRYLFVDLMVEKFRQEELDDDTKIEQDELVNVDNGDMVIFRIEPERGFCRLLVETDGDNVKVSDWEMVEQ